MNFFFFFFSKFRRKKKKKKKKSALFNLAGFIFTQTKCIPPFLFLFLFLHCFFFFPPSFIDYLIAFVSWKNRFCFPLFLLFHSSGHSPNSSLFLLILHLCVEQRNMEFVRSFLSRKGKASESKDSDKIMEESSLGFGEDSQVIASRSLHGGLTLFHFVDLFHFSFFFVFTCLGWGAGERLWDRREGNGSFHWWASGIIVSLPSALLQGIRCMEWSALISSRKWVPAGRLGREIKKKKKKKKKKKTCSTGVQRLAARHWRWFTKSAACHRVWCRLSSLSPRSMRQSNSITPI